MLLPLIDRSMLHCNIAPEIRLHDNRMNAASAGR